MHDLHAPHAGRFTPAGVPLIPVSARAAGRTAKPRGQLTGSDIAADALEEQRIATQAAKLLGTARA